MAMRVETRLVDDLDGSTATETVRFGLDGVEYEIDLTTEHAAELRGPLERFVSAARRTGGRKVTGAPSATKSDRGELAKAREWARDHGHEVKDRGRLPQNILDEYRASVA